MNWVSMLNGWQWALILAVPPAIVLLYFLKLKRQPLEIPSTFLWHRTIEDLHVNSIWQRLRRNLLLLLQLLLVLLAILSLLRPTWKSTEIEGQRFIFLVDASASMSATDVKPTRLDEVKRQLLELVQNGLKPGSVVMLISFSDRAIVEQPFTDNRRLLEAKIRAIQQTERPSVLDEALRVAAGLANPERSGTESEGDVASADAKPATLMVFSDGRFRTIPKFAMGNLAPEYHPIGSPQAKNVAISAFSATAAAAGGRDSIQVFATIQNFCDFDTQVTANLYLDDKLIDASKVQLSAEGSAGIEFQMSTVERGQLRLDLAETDDLDADDTAHAAINTGRRAKVLLVTPRNSSLETALSTAFATKLADVKVGNVDVLASDTYKRESATGEYDLIIYDQCVPESMPQANTFFLGKVPPGGSWQHDELQQIPQIIDADFAHPLLQFMSLGDVSIIDCRPLKVPKGGSVLVESQFGPLLAIAPRDGFEDLVAGFQLVETGADGTQTRNTNWQYRPSFPVFIGNLLAHAGGSSGERESQFIEPGQNIALRTSATVDEIRVESPTGQQLRISRGPQNTFVYGNTDRKGVYKVYEGSGKEISNQFSVNLFDAVESNIKPNESISTTYEELAGQAAWQPTRREGWKYLLGAALILLIVEWYVYNRRVYL